MKSTEVVKELKKLLDAARNDEILPAVEALIAARDKKRQPVQPVLVAMAIDPESGQYWPASSGTGGEDALARAKMLQGALRHFDMQGLAPAVERMQEQRIRAEVQAELERRRQDEERDDSDGAGDEPDEADGS